MMKSPMPVGASHLNLFKRFKITLSLSIILTVPLASLCNASSLVPSKLSKPAVTQPPNDPLFGQQWALHNDGSQVVVLRKDNYHADVQHGVAGVDIGLLQARNEIQRLAKSPVVVAIIDTGIDTTHPDLKGRILSDGHDFLPPIPSQWGPAKVPPMGDDWGHGTEMAGVIAADSNNGVGVTGIAPQTVKIMPLRVIRGRNDYQNFQYIHKNRQGQVDVTGKYFTDYVADAIHYAIDHHANIINISNTWPSFINSTKVRQAFLDANKAGILIVTIAGNDRTDSTESPCNYEGVICVGAITNTGKMAYFSDYGGNIDVLAPGDGILTTYPFGMLSLAYRVQGYELASGTSIAAPHVTALAAILESINPKISLNELRARIFLSASQPPQIVNDETSKSFLEPAALFGLINVKRAIDAKPQPVFYPDFKQSQILTVAESSHVVQDHIAVQNLWAPATHVKAQIYVNGKLSGNATAAVMASGAKLEIPWRYQLSSLDDSNLLHLELRISDSSGEQKTFFNDTRIARDLSKIAAQKTFAIPKVPPSAWLAHFNDTMQVAVADVPPYGFSTGMPRYYGFNNSASPPYVVIYDPSRRQSHAVTKIQEPGLQSITQVFRLDANDDGKMDWVVVGTGSNFLQFRFYNSQFQPLWGSVANSIWQVSTAGAFGQLIENHLYASPESWLSRNGRLVPCFMASGSLPPGDNFNTLDIRFFQTTNHIYYLEPLPANQQFTPLKIRAVDNAKFRDPYRGSFTLTGWLPPSAWDLSSGHLRALGIVGDGWNARTVVFDTATKEVSNINLDTLATLNSQGLYVQTLDHTGSEGAFVNFENNTNGSFTWFSSLGAIGGRTDFSYQSPENPLVTPPLLGLFDLPGMGHVWFTESQFDLQAFQQPTSGGTQMLRTVSLDRDSNFPSDMLAAQFMPVIVGTSAQPSPGIYMNLSLVHNGYLTIATWNAKRNEIERTTRYTFLVPKNCAEMQPVQTGPSIGSFSIPMFCEAGPRLEFRLVQPQ